MNMSRRWRVKRTLCRLIAEVSGVTVMSTTTRECNLGVRHHNRKVRDGVRNLSCKYLTVSSRGRLSLTAPTQPRQPITMMMVPTAMSRLAADREGRDDDRVAKFPWVTESHTPTPSMPHPPNCKEKTQRDTEPSVCKQQSQTLLNSNTVKRGGA